MKRPKKLQDFEGTPNEHLKACIEYSKETGKGVPLNVFKSMEKAHRTTYLCEIYDEILNETENK